MVNNLATGDAAEVGSYWHNRRPLIRTTAYNAPFQYRAALATDITQVFPSKKSLARNPKGGYHRG